MKAEDVRGGCWATTDKRDNAASSALRSELTGMPREHFDRRAEDTLRHATVDGVDLSSRASESQKVRKRASERLRVLEAFRYT